LPLRRHRRRRFWQRATRESRATRARNHQNRQHHQNQQHRLAQEAQRARPALLAPEAGRGPAGPGKAPRESGRPQRRHCPRPPSGCHLFHSCSARCRAYGQSPVRLPGATTHSGKTRRTEARSVLSAGQRGTPWPRKGARTALHALRPALLSFVNPGGVIGRPPPTRRATLARAAKSAAARSGPSRKSRAAR
jgi:hypothetical protein